MARYNERSSSRQSRFSEEEEPRSTSRRPASSGRRQPKQAKVEYYPIFSLFGSEQRDGRLAIDIKAYDGKNGSIEDHLSLDEFLFFCEKLYYGEPLEGEEYGVKLVGSLWEMDNPTKESTHSGNIRFSEEKLKAIKDEYEAAVGGKKKKAPAKAAPAKAARAKSKYAAVVEETDEEEDDDYYEEEEVAAAPVKVKKQRPQARVLDMPVEEMGEPEAEDVVEEEEIPY